MKGQPIHDSARAEAQNDHERVSCGLFWAVGKYKPTNCMIVSSITTDQALLPRFHVVLRPGTVLTALLVRSSARGH